MIRKLLPLFMLFGLLVVPSVSHAQINVNSTGIGTTAAAAGYSSAADPAAIIGQMISVVLGLVGFVFFIYVLWAGFLWMTAQGNAEQVQKATGMIKNGIIGFIIIVAAYAISTAVINAITTGSISGATTSSSTTP